MKAAVTRMDTDLEELILVFSDGAANDFAALSRESQGLCFFSFGV